MSKDGLTFSDGTVVHAAYIQSLFKASAGYGVLSKDLRGTTQLNVTEKSTPDMGVLVYKGTALLGNKYNETNNTNLSISNGDASNPRIDLIIYDRSASSPAVIEGTPDAHPTVPDVTDDSDIMLALVNVDTGESTSINNADIIDVRAFVSDLRTLTTKKSTNLRFSNTTERTTVSTSVVKVKEMLVNRYLTGVTVEWGMKSGSGGAAYIEVYVNGSTAPGSSGDTTTSTSYVTKSKDLSLTVKPGDLLQLYGSAYSGDICYVKDWKIYFDDVIEYTNQDP